MASLETGKVGVVESNGTQYGYLEKEHTRVTRVGRTVYLKPNNYIKTNHYINESRKYVGKHKLTRYLYFRYMEWVYLLIFIASIFTIFSAAYAFIMTIVNGIFFVIWLQHMYVNVGTMPHVLRQPSLPDHQLELGNNLLRISVEKYRALFAHTNEELIGIVGGSSDSVTVQVFRHSSMTIMKICVAVSSIAFISSVAMLIYCLSVGIIGALE